MSSDIDSASSAHAAGDPSGLPFDPPGSVRMTAELHYRYSDDRRPIVNQYLRGHRVGKGQHGEVWVCWDLSDDRRELAIKAVKRNNPRAEKMNMLRRRNIPASSHTPLTEKLGSLEHKIRKEIAIMKKCRHGHVVRLLEVIDDKLNDRIYMVMEYLSGGEIKWRNEQNEPVLQVDQCRRICRDVILGLEYLHYQGIIHRDIKPANLLWTADRQMVKISDFGVSHFSYAQRLAAAGRGNALDDANDPILLDDSDLSKRAGTPPFLAPEVIAEYNGDPSPSISASATSTTLPSLRSAPHIGSSSTVRPNTSQRLQITKAIDVWALGVTLYCLLFGRIPFRPPDSSEYMLYNIICKNDWEPEDTMGYDRLPTCGRKPKDKKSEGFVVMNLLDKLLEKDPNKRMTLDQAKRYVWFLRDIPHHQEWLRQTSPSRIDMVEVSESDTRTAMTTVRFSWGWPKRLTRRLSSLFKGVRPSRATSSRPDEDDFGVCSSPTIAVERHKSVSGRMSSSEFDEEGKRRGIARSVIVRNDSTPNMGRREESIERWARNASMSRARDSSRPPSRQRESKTLLPLDQSQPGASYSQGSTSRGRDNANTPLRDDAMFLGAGGVCNDPSSLISSNLPLGLNQSICHSPAVLRHPQPERIHIAPPTSVVPEPSLHDSGHSRHLTVRSATQSPSPLQQVAYESESSTTSEDDYDDLDDDSSFFRDTHRDRQAESEALQASTSLMYGGLDEDESDEETVPIEVKRRRPSVSVSAASPVPVSDFSDDAH
ncbi:kinase-like domain-containing protein [Suillus fuscotomentosus]|uniref:Kinase-like domain-containing protein n=1 Tax=Suillus fuscotomentosus TaxID=1912939 RepID=A0AAD4EFU3_9AGAM|nr:kinase-like domain-containing protein [Suillus fuscotomentosus]KAG1905362.1 kinase-like domain-containing protein [Suillus fuscotomentosus]